MIFQDKKLLGHQFNDEKYSSRESKPEGFQKPGAGADQKKPDPQQCVGR